jgi:hypothetical protein
MLHTLVPAIAVSIPLPLSPAMAVAIPLSSIEKIGKKVIQQDDKQQLEEHMQHMEAVVTAMFITGAPPTKKLRKNATSESTGIIPPSREVFTLPQVFLADPRGMTQNDTESVWIHADSEQGVELNFTWVLAFPVHADPHRSAQIPSENHTDTRNVLGQFRVKIYLHGLGLVLFCAVSDSDC